jgi:hypothetical protein
MVAEDLVWVWADCSPGAVEEAMATPAAKLAPEAEQFGKAAYWSGKLFLAGQTALGFWYQR